jgi:hypothetical protein
LIITTSAASPGSGETFRPARYLLHCEMPLTANSQTTNQESTHEDLGMMREIEVKEERGRSSQLSQRRDGAQSPASWGLSGPGAASNLEGTKLEIAH